MRVGARAEAATDVKRYRPGQASPTVHARHEGQRHADAGIGGAAPDPDGRAGPSPRPAQEPEEPKPPKPAYALARGRRPRGRGSPGNARRRAWPRAWASCAAGAYSRWRPTRPRASKQWPGRTPRRSYAKSTDQGQDDALRQDAVKAHRTDAEGPRDTKVEDALFKMGGVEVAEFVDQPPGARPPTACDAPVLEGRRSRPRARAGSRSGRRTEPSTPAGAATRPS